MQGTDPIRFMQGVAGKPDSLQDRVEIEILLDELEYLREVLDPELQNPAYDLAEQLRGKREQAG